MKCAHPVLVSFSLPRRPLSLFDKPAPCIVRRYVPCGRCLYCRKRRANQWSFRLNEEYEHTVKCFKSEPLFITLTYAKENLPEHGNLHYRDVRLFLARLRRFNHEGHLAQFRYFCIGEYGYNGTERPHYHILFFPSFALPPSFSKYIVSAWGKGLVTVDPITPGRIGYVANYCSLSNSYGKTVKPFARMSLRPAIGFSYLLSDELYRNAIEGNFSVWRVFTRNGQTIKYRLKLPDYYVRKFTDPQRYYDDVECIDRGLATSYRLEKCHQIRRAEASAGELQSLLLSDREYNSILKPVLYRSPFTNTVYSFDPGYWSDIRRCFDQFSKSHQNRNPLQRITSKHFDKWLTSLLPRPSKNRGVTILTSLTRSFTLPTLEKLNPSVSNTLFRAILLEDRSPSYTVSPLCFPHLWVMPTRVTTGSLCQPVL